MKSFLLGLLPSGMSGGFALALLVILSSLTAWGFFERSGKLQCYADKAVLNERFTVLGTRVEETNQKVQGLADATTASKAASEKALAEALRRAQGLTARAEATQQQATAAAASGARDCASAIARLRKGDL